MILSKPHDWLKVRKLVVGETWAATASPFTIRAVVMGAKSSVVMGAKSSVVMGAKSSADTGNSNGKGRVMFQLSFSP